VGGAGRARGGIGGAGKARGDDRTGAAGDGCASGTVVGLMY
jgi:hypothetical protein